MAGGRASEETPQHANVPAGRALGDHRIRSRLSHYAVPRLVAMWPAPRWFAMNLGQWQEAADHTATW